MAVPKRILVPHFREQDTTYLHLVKVCEAVPAMLTEPQGLNIPGSIQMNACQL